MCRSEARTLVVGLLRTRRASADDGLREALQRQGLRVALEEQLSQFAHGLRWQRCPVDALLLNMELADETELDLLDRMLERVALPLVFQDGQAPVGDEIWLQRLIAKIEAAVGDRADAGEVWPTRPAPAEHAGLRCWVLGASFGGPEALKRFFGALPALPADTALIIGQHIAAGFVDVLASQLSRAGAFTVSAARDGDSLESGRIYVAPVQERLRIEADGRLRLDPAAATQLYMPSIDQLMCEVARRFGPRSGAIVFSGMGDDGARGCVAIYRAGGVVWAQAADSCACDSMPVCAKATGAVSYEGTPEELAARLAEHLVASPAAAHTGTA